MALARLCGVRSTRTAIVVLAAMLVRAPLSAQVGSHDQRTALAGTWYLRTAVPVYDTMPRQWNAPRPSGPPVLVPRDRVRFSEGPIPVPPRASSAYSTWVELNPRDSIEFAVDDSSITIIANGAAPVRWITDGVLRSAAIEGELVRTRAQWKGDRLRLERSGTGRGGVERQFRITRSGELELTFPGIVRRPDYPGKYVFGRIPPPAAP